MSPYRTPLGVWLEKTGYLADVEPTSAMKWGSLLEPVVTDEFERETGLVVRSRQQQLQHPDHPWMLATVDGFVAENCDLSVEPLGLFENKTTGPWRREWGDAPPTHVALQVNHYLAVTGLERAWVALLVGGQSLEIFTLERDQDVIDLLIELESAFWNHHVLPGIPPPAAASDGEVLREAYADAGVASVELPELAADLIARRDAAKDQEKASLAEIELVEAQLMELLGLAELGLVAGQPVISWKRFEREHVDLAKLRVRHPEVVAQFTEKRPYRRFGTPKGKE